MSYTIIPFLALLLPPVYYFLKLATFFGSVCFVSLSLSWLGCSMCFVCLSLCISGSLYSHFSLSRALNHDCIPKPSFSTKSYLVFLLILLTVYCFVTSFILLFFLFHTSTSRFRFSLINEVLIFNDSLIDLAPSSVISLSFHCYIFPFNYFLFRLLISYFFHHS